MGEEGSYQERFVSLSWLAVGGCTDFAVWPLNTLGVTGLSHINLRNVFTIKSLIIFKAF